MRSSWWFRSGCIACFSGGILAAQPDAAVAQPLPSLFVDLAPAPTARVARSADAVRTRRLSLRADLLAAALAPGTTVRAPFVLNLFPDVVLALTRERLESDTRGNTSWVGTVEGDQDSVASLTWNGRTLVGGVVTRGVSFDIHTDADGAVSVSQHVAADMPVELAPAVPAPSTAARAASPLTAAGDASTADIDLLVLYTAAARVRAGGESQIQSQLANAVAVTNTAFQRSGVNAVLRTAGLQELPYTESANLGSDLSAISFGGVQSAVVEAARTTSGADLVTLVTGRASSSGGCGIAWIGPSAGATYSVSEHACLYAGQWSFSHELGHNLGADHAPGDSAPAGVSYARGYRDSTVRTLMAYAVFGSPLRILNYSSATVRDPDGTGVPTGDSLQDNARRLNETVASVAGYLPPPSGSGLPPAPTGLSEQMTGTTTTLSWTAVAGANAYVVQGGTAPGDSGQFNSAVSGASFTRSLAPGTYYWRVRAQNSMGVGPGSPEATFTVAATNPVPGAPIGFASNVSGSTVTVSWSPPSSGGTVTSYDIEGGSSPGSAAYGHLTVAQSPQVFTNVPNGIFYLRVRAVGPAGASTPSADAVATVGALCAPPGISTLSTGMAGPTITLNWTTPSGTGPFTYVLAVGSGAGASNLGVYPMGGTNTVTATPPAGTYFVRVIAASACGVGGASSDLIVTVPPG